MRARIVGLVKLGRMQAMAPSGGCPLSRRRPLPLGRRPVVAARTATVASPAAWSSDLVRKFDGDGDGKLTYVEAEQLLLAVQVGRAALGGGDACVICV